MLSDWCPGFLIKILLKNAIIIGFLRQRFVYFLKLYLVTHISQTQDSFNSVFVIVVNVQTCCLARYTSQTNAIHWYVILTVEEQL